MTYPQFESSDKNPTNWRFLYLINPNIYWAYTVLSGKKVIYWSLRYKIRKSSFTLKFNTAKFDGYGRSCRYIVHV